MGGRGTGAQYVHLVDFCTEGGELHLECEPVGLVHDISLLVDRAERQRIDRAQLCDIVSENGRAWPTRRRAELAIFELIAGWYNQHRRHSTLGYSSPAEVERRTSPVTLAA